MPKKKKPLSPIQLGDFREEAFRDLRISQGMLSFKRNRPSFAKQRKGNNSPDMWGLFDICSMNEHVVEFAQVKGHDTRDEQKLIKIWLAKNHGKIPNNVRCIVAYHRPELKDQWRIVVIREAN